MSLEPEYYKKLEGIVNVMEEDKVSSDSIQTYIDDYYTEYDNKPYKSSIPQDSTQTEIPTVQAEGLESMPGGNLTLPKGSTFGGFISGVGQMIDYVGGAPVRAGIHAALTAEADESRTWEAVKDFAMQYGKNPADAPTGKDIAQEMGLSDQALQPWQQAGLNTKVSPADVTGFLMDIGMDWTNVVPGKAIAGAFFKGAGKTAKPIVQAGAVVSDVVSGTKVPTSVGKSLAESIDEGSKALKKGFADEVIESFPESVEIARKLDIPVEHLPAAVKYGKKSLTSRLERFTREGPMGQEQMKWYVDGAEKLEKGLGRQVKALGTPQNMADAGKQMQGAFDKGLKNFFDDTFITHNRVIKGYPGLKINEGSWKTLEKHLNGMDRVATGIEKRGITATQRGQAEHIRKAVEGLRNSKGSYKQVYEALQNIGEAAYKSNNSLADIPVDVQKMRKLYRQVRTVLEQTIKKDVKGGKALLKPLKENNLKMHEMFKDKDAIGNIMGNIKSSPEAKYSSILSGTNRIKALKRFLGPEDMNKLKASYLENNIIKRTTDGNVLWAGLSSRLKQARIKGTLNELFGPTELDAINDYVRLADRFGEDVLSSSGTGASISFGQYLKGTGSYVAESLTAGPIRAVAGAKGATPEKVLPFLRSPGEYAKGWQSRLKGVQVIGVQKEAQKRQEERTILGEYYKQDFKSAPYKKVDELIKRTKRFNEMKPGKMKDLTERTIKRLIKEME